LTEILNLVTYGGGHKVSWAAQYGSLTVTKILLKQGANVNARDYEGGTPWTWLIYAGDSASKSLPATEVYLREKGAKEVCLRGIKLAWAWVLTYSHLPHIFGRVSKVPDDMNQVCVSRW
jgi:hypothetical protein